MNPQKPMKPFTGNPFAQVAQKAGESLTNNRQTNNPFNLSVSSTNQPSSSMGNLLYPGLPQPPNVALSLSQKPPEKTSETSNASDKTVKMANLSKINEAFNKSNNPAVNAYNVSIEGANTYINSSQAQKRSASNIAKKSSKRPNQREQIIVIDQSQTNTPHIYQTNTTSEIQKNIVIVNNKSSINSPATGTQNANRTSQTMNQNQSFPSNFFQNNNPSNLPSLPDNYLPFRPRSDDFGQIKQDVQMVTNKSNTLASQIQNSSATITGGILGQVPTSGQTIISGLPQNNIGASFNNKNQASGQISSNQTNAFPFGKTQNQSSNPNLSASRVQANNYQSTNVFNNVAKNNTNSQTQNSNVPSVFSQIQNNNNKNANQNSMPSSFNTPTVNQNYNTNPNHNNLSPFNNQNQSDQSANQNQNPQFSQSSNNRSETNDNHNNCLNQHFVSEMTADQYYEKTKALHHLPSQHHQGLIQQLEQLYQNEDIDLNIFLHECIQNLQYIHQGLEELSTRPAILIDQFEQNKILQQKCKQLETILALQPHNMLVKIKKIESRQAEGLNCTEKMWCKMQEQIEHHLSAATKDLEEMNEQIEQQALDLPSQSQHDIIKLYNHLTSIDSELCHLNQIADHYINLLQTQ